MLPELIAKYSQIQWSNLLSNQWDSTMAIVFLDLSTLWERMTIQEQWEPLSPQWILQSKRSQNE